MNKILKAALLATVSTCVISPVNYASAQVPVIDATANASLITQIGHQVSMLSSLAQQITQLTDLVSLATVASTALGDTVSPELGQLFSSMQGAYTQTNKAYGSILAVPSNIDRELALFQPPAGGWESMSTPQLLQRAQQIRKLTAGTNAASVARQADALERRLEIAAQAARANGMADRSISALSATQAVAQQMRVTSQILAEIEESNNDIAANIAMRNQQDLSDKDIVDGIRNLGRDEWKKMVQSGAGKPMNSVLEWGN